MAPFALSPGLGRFSLTRRQGGGVPAPAIVLSATSIAEDAEIGAVVATLSISNLPDGVTVTGYTLTADPDDVFDISTDGLITTAALDYEAATSHAYTIEAALSEGGPVTRSDVIAVTNVFEEPDLVALTLDAGEIVSGSEEGTVVGEIVGRTDGSTVSLFDDAGGRFKLSGGQILAGATATDYDTATSHNITTRETLADSSNSPRDSVIAVTVVAANPFVLEDYLATLDRAFAYDFSQTDRHFQDVTGVTLADEAGENIALAFDSAMWGGSSLSAVLAAATQRVTNGAFTVDTSGWTASNVTLSSVGGKMSVVPTDNFTRIGYQQAITVAGGFHYLDFDYDQSTAVTPRYYVGTSFTVADIISLTTVTGVGSIHRGFVAPGTSAYLHFGAVSSAGLTVLYDNVSLVSVPGKPAVQATANFCPKRQSNGATFDGSDDRSATSYGLSGSGDLFMFDYADIPASLASTQILFGAQDGSSNAAYVGVTTTGALRAKLGSTVVDSTGVDLRGGRHKLGAFTVGSTVYLVADDVVVGSGTWAGSLPTTTWNLGCVNADGTPGAFFAGSLLCPVHGRDTIDIARANEITSAIAAKG